MHWLTPLPAVKTVNNESTHVNDHGYQASPEHVDELRELVVNVDADDHDFEETPENQRINL